MSWFRVGRAAVVAAVVGGVLLSACSGSDDGTDDDAAPSSTGPTSSDGSGPSADESAATQKPPPEVDPEAIQIAVIGDSIPYAQGDCGGCTAYVDLYARHLEKKFDRPVIAENLSARDGLRGATLLTRIHDDEFYRQRVAVADVVILSIGHDDQPWNASTSECDAYTYGPFEWESWIEPCISKRIRAQSRVVTDFLAEAASLRSGEPTVFLVATDYNDVITPDADRAEIATSTAVLDAYRDGICRAARRADAVCVDVYPAFNGADGREPAGDLLAPDGVHPSAEGHQAIAQVLADLDVAKAIRRLR